MIKPWRWIEDDGFVPVRNVLKCWRLRDGAGNERAAIWMNSGNEYTWHTYDQHGTGGENASATSLDDAKLFCVACIVRQGWAPGGWEIAWS